MARRRYLKHFGAFNQHISLRNHSFVLLDAPGLIEEDYQRVAVSQGFERWTPLRDGPVEFVKSIASGTINLVIANLSALLLYRSSPTCDPSDPCPTFKTRNGVMRAFTRTRSDTKRVRSRLSNTIGKTYYIIPTRISPPFRCVLGRRSRLL
jgi:hypothetical protein